MRTLKTLLILIATVSAFSLAGYLVAQAFWLGPAEPELLIATPEIAKEGVVPTKINIPSINISTEIVPVGLAESGRIAVPTSYRKAAWYKHGPQPGEAGVAVLLGHVDNGVGLPAVFYKLAELNTGEVIRVEDSSGVTRTFTVVSKQTLPYSANLNDLNPNEGEPALVLVTCTGTWIPSKKMYSDRLIVRAVMTSNDDL